MNAQDKQHLETLIHSARIVVRETGCAAQKIESHGPGKFGMDPPAGDPWTIYHQIMHAYDMACAHLIQLDPAGAASFIKSTYGLSFRQTAG